MPKVLCIPDIHLKSWILDSADAILASRDDIDHIVLLGDYVDEWGHEDDRESYDRLFDKLQEFALSHPEARWCYGNHDFGYVHANLDIWCSGRSETLLTHIQDRFAWLRDNFNIDFAVMHEIDGVLFSHAGCPKPFYDWLYQAHGMVPPHETDPWQLASFVNGAATMKPRRFWEDDSPLWFRPKYADDPCGIGVFQVTGHTPVAQATLQADEFLVCDTFSTHRSGSPIGDESFTLIDTETKNWEDIPIMDKPDNFYNVTQLPLPTCKDGYTVAELASMFGITLRQANTIVDDYYLTYPLATDANGNRIVEPMSLYAFQVLARDMYGSTVTRQAIDDVTLRWLPIP